VQSVNNQHGSQFIDSIKTGIVYDQEMITKSLEEMNDGLPSDKADTKWQPTGKDFNGKYTEFKRELSTDEIRNRTFQVFKIQSYFRGVHGGQTDPQFYLNDSKALGRKAPADIEILQFKPQPKAQGFQRGASGYWDTYTGKAVKFVGIPGKEMTNEEFTALDKRLAEKEIKQMDEDESSATEALKCGFQKLKKKQVETVGDLLNEVKKNNVKIYSIPYIEILKEIGKETMEEQLSKLTRMINVLALGASFGLTNYDKKYVEKAINMIFEKKQKVIPINLLAFNKAYTYAKQHFVDTEINLKAVATDEQRIFLQGTQAVALGKLAGGCRVQTYYPITPAA
jgi:hypothetical protein